MRSGSNILIGFNIDIKLSLSFSNCLHNRVVLRKRNVSQKAMQQANVTEAAVIVKSYRSVIVAYTTESRARGLGERESGERGPWECEG